MLRSFALSIPACAVGETGLHVFYTLEQIDGGGLESERVERVYEQRMQ